MKRVVLTILFLCFVVVAEESTPKRLHLTPAQVKYYQQMNDEIEALPEVKALRAKQQAFITGVAMAGGIESAWRLLPDGKGGADVEAVGKEK